ncbi:MAG: GYD domain-containing protein [Acidobacteriia bacterium]|nr:GYD domain-containing protein [Terriglobia bacterium]
MAKLLVTGKYTAEGTKGLIKEGGSKRKAAVEKAIKGLGGKLESIYYAYGDADVYVVIDMPDTSSALALSLVVNASGAVHVNTIPLITVEEVDAACKKSVDYRAAGA